MTKNNVDKKKNLLKLAFKWALIIVCTGIFKYAFRPNYAEERKKERMARIEQLQEYKHLRDSFLTTNDTSLLFLIREKKRELAPHKMHHDKRLQESRSRSRAR